MAVDHHRDVQIDATQAGIDEAMLAFRVFVEEMGLDHDAMWELRVALSEWLVNVMTHAYEGQDGGPIAVRYSYAQDEMAVEVTDEGPSFDPLLLVPPDTSEAADQRRIGGLGVHFIRHLMDRVSHARVGGRNTLTMAKRAVPIGTGMA